MDMDFELSGLGLRTTGRTSAKIAWSVERELESSDLARLGDARGVDPSPIKKLRERHHALAKMIAQGIPDGEAGLATGYTASRVSILKSDPSFQELLAFYSAGVRERYYDMHEAAAALGRDAVEEIHDRLEDKPEDFTVGQLLEIGKTMMDRTGQGPRSSTNVNVNIGLAEKLEAARKRTQVMRDITPKVA